MTPEQFKAWRKRLDFTQDDAAEFLGLSVGTIGNYEAGRRRDGGDVEIPLSVALACVAVSLGFEDYVEKDLIIARGHTADASDDDKRLSALGVAQDERVYLGDVKALQHKVANLEKRTSALEQRAGVGGRLL